MDKHSEIHEFALMFMPLAMTTLAFLMIAMSNGYFDWWKWI